MVKYLKYILLLLVILTGYQCTSKKTPSFEIKDGNFFYNGKPFKIYSGEMHYPRVPSEYWRHRFKMMRAMGLNTVATYVFWNYHNISPGVWDFETGNHNLAEYIRIASEEGLFVILRPGPYVCAEWEFGGYPWWLLKNKDLKIRADNKPFLDSCRIYFNMLAREVKDLQVSHGGPVILVQIENEFGSYISQTLEISFDEHQKYYHSIRDMLIEAGFDGSFFTSDATSFFKYGTIEGVLPTANGEGNVDMLKKSVDEYFPGGPYMVAEYYPGWLDHWNEPFVQISAEENVKQIRKYLQNNISFNFYMVHGGTNFGFYSGANYNENHDIQPDITSYDYDAPISEAGWVTDKYIALRNEMQEYIDHALPVIPEKIPVLDIPDIKLTKSADVFDIMKTLNPVINTTPLTFEELDQGYGYVLYSKKFRKAIKGILKIDGIRDYALLYVNSEKVGELNRMNKQYSTYIEIPPNGILDILVENMGRINYGADIIHNRKGIISPVYINNIEIVGNWQMFKLPLKKPPVINKNQNSSKTGRPAFYTGNFEINEPGDIFFDMRGWGKGIVFVNGINLGRYWNIGPQQTLYLPSCWLRRGVNEVLIFEQQNDIPQEVLTTTNIPVLNELAHPKTK